MNQTTNNNKLGGNKGIKKLCYDLLKHKKLYLIVLPIVFVLTVLYALSLPNYYQCSVKLSPELSGSKSNSNLSTLASGIGIDLGSTLSNSSDALRPLLYPELMTSVDFKAALLKVKVKRQDGEEFSYYDYLRYGQKLSWMNEALRFVFGSLEKKDTTELDPHRMTKKQTHIAKSVERRVVCAVDKKTSVITIKVTDNDPEVCTTIADSAMVLLQRFITDYRTRKARVDLEYNQKMYDEAKSRYDELSKEYAQTVDANLNSFMETVRQRRTNLETQVQIQRNIYQQVATRLKQAEMKVQEDTPAFAVVQASTVPAKKSGPKRASICLITLFVAFVVVSLYVLYKEDDLKSLFLVPLTPRRANQP